MTGVVGLGYVVVSATDLDAWEDFACGLLGLQCAVKDTDQLQLRMDDKSYRLDIRRSDEDNVQTLGWEVRGERELREVADRLRDAGYSINDKTDDDARERRVSGLVGLEDPDGASLELFYGLKKDRSPFVSPLGARFCTGLEGLGHAFQLVSDTDAFWHLYVDLLGFKLSDYIDFAPGFTGTFLHCNPRHHSFAFAQSPEKGIQHLMFEVDNIDAVGRAYDKVLAGSAPITATFGKHSNDEMLSFYSKTPSGFSVEYGTAGISIDDETWTPARYDVPSFWGHQR
jgi:3,4-dihydroxy-9,10-secoandrosta-1,3,5(10)-triene-9,17-dione 4,5-dioxygenase